MKRNNSICKIVPQILLFAKISPCKILEEQASGLDVDLYLILDK